MQKGEIAVVTGSASGVGKVVTSRLLEAGNHVIGIDQTWPAGSQQTGLVQLTGDVAAEETWQQVQAEVNRQPERPLSMLVINAAKLVVGPLLDLSDDSIRETFDVNVWGAIRAVKACMPAMLSRGDGSIVAVASVDALLAEQDLAAYCTSKAALLQLIRTVAVDYAGQGIRANAVCPGPIDTPFLRRHIDAAENPEEALRVKIERHPAGRILEPEDVAAAVLFLLSAQARGVNGTQLTVDGALTSTFDYHPRESSHYSF